MEATLHTNHGDIVVELYPNHAPKTVANFVELATGRREWTNPATGEKTTEPLYNGTIFHRVIDEDEIHPELNFNDPYVLAMANAGPGTNGSQFFITVAPTTWLYGKHTVFGKVVDDASKAVVDEIAKVSTDMRDKPAEDVVIESVDVAE